MLVVHSVAAAAAAAANAWQQTGQIQSFLTKRRLPTVNNKEGTTAAAARERIWLNWSEILFDGHQLMS